MERAFIFDVDGVLADNTHRQGLLKQEGKTSRARWAEFFEAGKDDPAYEDTLRLVHTLQAYGYTLLIVTGRAEPWRDQLEEWLQKRGIFPERIWMRGATDFRKDWEIKESVLKEIQDEKRYSIIGVFEDNTSCVKMWRAHGLTCYQPREENY